MGQGKGSLLRRLDGHGAPRKPLSFDFRDGKSAGLTPEQDNPLAWKQLTKGFVWATQKLLRSTWNPNCPKDCFRAFSTETATFRGSNKGNGRTPVRGLDPFGVC